jgi:hypothetical protein
MTISIIHETRPSPIAPKSEALRRRLTQELNRSAVPAAKIITFLGLGVFCVPRPQADSARRRRGWNVEFEYIIAGMAVAVVVVLLVAAFWTK